MKVYWYFIFGIFIVYTICCKNILSAQTQLNPPEKLAAPVENGKWLIPAKGDMSEPVWGIKDGIGVGLWPTRGPRGLIRIYTPYLGQGWLRPINYIAIEPIVKGKRGFSEMEQSQLNEVQGLAMWTSDELEDHPKMRNPWEPARGKVIKIDGVNALTFFVYIECFKNGAQPVIQVILREDRPYEITLRSFASKDSTKMDSCILSATMGNYAHLRLLWLNGEVVDSRKLWPDFTGDGFAKGCKWETKRLFSVDGDIIVAAMSDEENPANAEYADDVPSGWKYKGKPGIQYWRTIAQKNISVQVNGRRVYWKTNSEIPGGIAYENFELQLPYISGQELRFGVTPEPPEKLGFKKEWSKNLTNGK